MKTAKIKSLKIIVATVFAIVLAGGGYWLASQKIAHAPLETDETANWQIYRNRDFGFKLKYPRDWKLEFPPLPYSEEDFGFHFISTSKSIPEQIIITVSCYRGSVANYVFKNCCKDESKIERIGNNEFYASGRGRFEGYQEWYYTTGDEELLIRFNFGVGRRSGNPDHPEDDYPSEESFSKEFSDFKLILSTFKWY